MIPKTKKAGTNTTERNIHKEKTAGQKTGKQQKEQDPEKKKLTNATKRKLFPAKEVNDSSSEDEETDAACLYCDELYSTSASNEGWIQCVDCKNWAHEQCSGADENDDIFMCDFCDQNLLLK